MDPHRQTYTHTYRRTHVCAPTHIQAYTHMCTLTQTDIHTHTYRRTHSCTHTHRRTHACAHSHIQTCTHTHTNQSHKSCSTCGPMVCLTTQWPRTFLLCYESLSSMCLCQTALCGVCAGLAYDRLLCVLACVRLFCAVYLPVSDTVLCGVAQPL